MSRVPYQSVVASLMYTLVCTRPEIGYAIRVVARFMTNLGKAHSNVVKWNLTYLKGTSRSCICLEAVILYCKAT
jgi:hypothetical protein